MNIDLPTSSVGLHLVAVWHSKLRHSVQCRATHQYLCRSSGEASRQDPISQDRLDAEDCRFGQRASMIAALFLPGGASNGSNPPQILIASQTFGLRVAVLPNLSIMLWWDCRPRFSSSNRLVTSAFVICAITRNLFNLSFNLIQQVRQYFALVVVTGRHYRGHNLATGLINPQMQFAPGATVSVAVLADFPFPFTKDFNP